MRELEKWLQSINEFIIYHPLFKKCWSLVCLSQLTGKCQTDAADDADYDEDHDGSADYDEDQGW